MDDFFNWLIVLGLIFLFWGEPDNWDKYNDMVDAKHQEQIHEQHEIRISGEAASDGNYEKVEESPNNTRSDDLRVLVE